MRDKLEQFVPRIYRFALRLTGDRHLAEDLTQETILRAWRGIDRLRDPRAAGTWTLRIAANLWRDQLRRGQRQVSSGGLSGEPVSTTLTPDRQAIQTENERRAREAMDRLPERQRQVLYLQACEGLQVAEIAEVLQISSGAVKSSLSLARKHMRRQLSGLLPEATGCRGGEVP